MIVRDYTAILKDSKGQIDLGLPVSGSLDDPQFSYGQIIWKAIINVITKIVTAPFRALGRLFGSSGEEMEAIVFDLGEDRLLPPEREKLVKLAQGLDQRPKLALNMRGAYHPEADAAVLRDFDLRRAIALEMGQEAALKGADLHGIMYQRLLQTEPVDEVRLQTLGGRRAEAIADTLRQAGLADARIQIGPPAKMEADDRQIRIRLGVAVAASAGTA